MANPPSLGQMLNYLDSVIPSYIPRCPGIYLRISNDPFGLEKGVDRQREDTDDFRLRIGWGAGREYLENDTSAFRKRRIVLADGKVIWRVIRPQFAKLLDDLENGVIDGVIFYDQDRLVRQPRDLEDLIDIIERIKRPVKGVTSDLDLMTSNGRATARMLVTMALKSSEDTQGRVRRAKFAEATSGGRTYGGFRPFGWQADRLTLHPLEAPALEAIVERVLAGENLNSITVWLQEESGFLPTSSERKPSEKSDESKRVPREPRWSRTVVAQMLRSPRLAGLRAYRGAGHGENRPGPLDWQRSVLRDKDGFYIQGPWQGIITIEDWERLNTYLDQQSRITESNEWNTRKYLLSGIARCGRCGAGMIGSARGVPGSKHKKPPAYQCPPKSLGGCNGVMRHMERMDRLVERLVLDHLHEQMTDETVSADSAGALVALEQEIASIVARKGELRQRYAQGVLSGEDFFPTLSSLDGELKSKRKDRVRIQPRESRVLNPEEEWDGATLSQRRAILKRCLVAVKVLPAAKAGRGSWNPDEIELVWRED